MFPLDRMLLVPGAWQMKKIDNNKTKQNKTKTEKQEHRQ